MSMYTSLHVEPGDRISVDEGVLIEDDRRIAVNIQTRNASNTVAIFTDNLSDLEEIAFKFTSLCQTLREVYGWTNNPPTA